MTTRREFVTTAATAAVLSRDELLSAAEGRGRKT